MLVNRRKSILLSILIAIGLLSTLAFSYAYTTVQKNGNEQQINSNSAKVSLYYEECNDKLDKTCGDINKNLKVNDSFTKKFTITNAGSVDVTIPLYFTNLKNSFKNDELIYSIKDVTNNVTLISKPVPYYEGLVSNIEAYPNLSISSGNTIDYEITVTFIDANQDQNYNLNAEYFIKLGILENALN